MRWGVIEIGESGRPLRGPSRGSYVKSAGKGIPGRGNSTVKTQGLRN